MPICDSCATGYLRRNTRQETKLKGGSPVLPASLPTILSWPGTVVDWQEMRARSARPSSPPGQKHEEIKRTFDRRGREVRARNSTPARSNSCRVVLILNPMTNLLCYLEGGRLEIDNNLTENPLRPILCGQKELFVLRPSGGRMAQHGDLLDHRQL